MAEQETTTEVPTETAPEIKGTPIVPEGMEDEYTGPRLIEPGMTNEKGEEVRSAEVEVEQESEKKTESDQKTEPVAAAPIETQEPEAIGVEDPGEFVPTDRSFDVIVYDAEGKNGQTKTIHSVDEWDSLLQGDPNLGSAAAMLKADRAAAKMDTLADREKADWEKEKARYDEATQLETQRVNSLNDMANEINYLATKGELPPVASQYENADWSDSEVAKQPGIAERIELLNYMRDENKVLEKAGLKPMTSVIAAWSAFQLDQTRKAEASAKVKAAEARKTAGARISGTNAAPVNVAPKGIMVGRPGALDT